MRIRAPLVATIVLCITLLSLDQLQSTEARAVHHDRVKRENLPSEEVQYLESLYNKFLDVFKSYRATRNSKQFSVATINRPEDLKPCPLVMNDDQGHISREHNYLAYTPIPSESQTRQGNFIHAETSIVNEYNLIFGNLNVGKVHLVSHFSPCKYCSEILGNLVKRHGRTTFYFGYVEEYQTTLHKFIDEVGSQENAHFVQISGQPRICPPEHVFLSRSNTCPVIGNCPSISEVNNLLQIMIAG